MGKKYHGYRAVRDGERESENVAYEVSSGKVIGYNVTKKGFFKKTFEYSAAGEYPITKNSIVDLWATYASGSGDVKLINDKRGNDFCIYGDAKGFTAEVQREIDNAPS